VKPRATSSPGWYVSRFGTPAAAGTTYTSVLPSYRPVKATSAPSGEKRGRLDPGVRGQATDTRAVEAGDPEVVRVGEGHELSAGRGIGDEPRVREVDGAGPSPPPSIRFDHLPARTVPCRLPQPARPCEETRMHMNAQSSGRHAPIRHPWLLAPLLLAWGLPLGWAADGTVERQDRARLEAVIQHANNVLKHGADTYRDKPSPLLANGINVFNREHLRWRFPDGRDAVVSDLSIQQNLMRILVALSNLIGDERYRSRAKAILAYHFEHCQDKGGLIQWGGHRFVDLATLRALGPDEKEGVHELKNTYPFYELMYEVDPEATSRFIRGFWNAHVYDWRTLEISRHGQYGLPLGTLWESPFDDPKPFLETKGLSFLDAGNDLIYAGAMLFQLASDRGALLWSKRLAHQYVKARDPRTKLGAYQYTRPKKTASTLDDRITLSWYGDRASRQFGPEFGEVALEGRLLLQRLATTIYSENALMQLQVAQALGKDAADLVEWTREGMVAYARYAYVLETNQLKPMLTDGTDLSDFVLKRDGYYGEAGEVLRRFPASNEFLLSYARGSLVTGDPDLWRVARGIAKANGLGDLGTLPGQAVQVNLGTPSDDPFALFAVLDLYRQTPKASYLQLARAIGNNILERRFHHGYFTPSEKRIYANVDAIEPYALLALQAAIESHPEKVPGFINGSGYLDGPYRFPDGTVRPIHDDELFEAQAAR
jgi:pectate lyase